MYALGLERGRAKERRQPSIPARGQQATTCKLHGVQPYPVNDSAHLVAETLAAASWHEDKGVVSSEHRIHDLLLSPSETPNAKDHPQSKL